MKGKSKILQSKRKFEFVFTLVFTLIFVYPANTQTEKPQTNEQNKIGVIFYVVFNDRENGIKEVVDAYDKLDKEFKSQIGELKLLIEQIVKMETEIGNLSAKSAECEIECSSEALKKKIDEYKSLTDTFKIRQDEVKLLYDKRKLELTADINKKIAGAIKQYAKEKGYQVIFDAEKLQSPSIDKSFDVTNEFIQYYNSISEKP